MAVFGAPIAHEDHAVRACYAALAIHDAMTEVGAELRRSIGIEPMIRIGINSGEVIVRSIDNDLTVEYDAIGPTVSARGEVAFAIERDDSCDVATVPLDGSAWPVRVTNVDYAWDPGRWPSERLGAWEEQWAARQFGPALALDIARLMTRYGQLQSRRKPELLNRAITLDPALDISKTEQAVVYRDGSPFSLSNYGEAERVTGEWSQLANESEAIRQRLAPPLRDAYYQLVHYPVASTANVYQLRLAQFRNILQRDTMAAQFDQFIYIKALEACLAQLCNIFCRDIVIAKLNQFVYV